MDDHCHRHGFRRGWDGVVGYNQGGVAQGGAGATDAGRERGVWWLFVFHRLWLYIFPLYALACTDTHVFGTNELLLCFCRLYSRCGDS